MLRTRLTPDEVAQAARDRRVCSGEKCRGHVHYLPCPTAREIQDAQYGICDVRSS